MSTNYFSKHLQSLLNYCKTGEDEGATLVYGGKRIDRQGKKISFLPPPSSSVLHLCSLCRSCLRVGRFMTLYMYMHVLCFVHLGFFMEPTIFTNVEDHMFIAEEESFGPVMVISIFENG